MLEIQSPPSTHGGRLLITGGAGFIGSHLSEALVERGYTVTALDDLSTGRLVNLQYLLDHPRFRFVEGSITDAAVTEPLVADTDVVFHLAAAVGVERIVNDPLASMQTNVIGTHEVLRLAHRYQRKVLIASTSEVYGKSSRAAFAEEDDRILGPTSKARWSYAESKALDEFLGLAYHQQRGLPVVIFRLFNTVGPRQTGQYGMVVPRFVGQALRGERLAVYGDGQQSRCFCDVQDAVRAIIGLAEYPAAVGHIFNIGSTHEISILKLACRVLRTVADWRGDHLAAASIDQRIHFVPYEQAYGPGFEDMRHRAPDISRIKAAIGWEPRVSLEQTLLRVCASLDPGPVEAWPARHMAALWSPISGSRTHTRRSPRTGSRPAPV